MRFHKCVEDAIKRLRNSGAKNTFWFYNTVLRHAWLDFLHRERQDLLTTGVNVTTSCYAKTGFFPFKPQPETWLHVLESLGKLNKTMKKGTVSENEENLEIQIKDNIDIGSILTKDESATLLKGMEGCNTAVDAVAVFTKGE